MVDVLTSFISEWCHLGAPLHFNNMFIQDVPDTHQVPVTKLNCIFLKFLVLAEDAIKAALSDYKVKQESLGKKE